MAPLHSSLGDRVRPYLKNKQTNKQKNTHTHTHTHTPVYLSISLSMSQKKKARFPPSEEELGDAGQLHEGEINSPLVFRVWG